MWEPNGRTREYLLYQVAEGREKVAALFLSPASDKGRSTLRVGDNMWMYVPNCGQADRITSLQSVIGGVFNNADILSLDYSAEYDVAKMEESGEDYLLELKAKTSAVLNAYALNDRTDTEGSSPFQRLSSLHMPSPSTARTRHSTVQ